ncbi:MAG: GntR family transcriptional regulator [Lentisphaerales bacterium]|nr:GntR family transcriptional regulator [Lentisphaerales bacterium]
MGVTDRVKNWISKDIRDGVYPPGTKLPTRMNMMEKYNIARASIDKVIRQLVEEGLLSSTQGSGTYVLDTRNSEPHLYIVLNTEKECEEANAFHNKLSMMLANVSKDLKHTIVGSKDFEKNFSEVLQNNRSRVIWSRPSIKSYGYIASLYKAGTPQILVNRPIPAYNFVTTDTRQAIKGVFEHVKSENDAARMGLIVPSLDLEESFLAEREVYFHQMVFEYGFSLAYMGRTNDKSTKEILPVIREALDRVEEMDYLFVPDFYMVPFVISLADERGIKIGKDLNVITIDWNEDLGGNGIICIKQEWDSMFQRALDWAQAETVEKVQEFIAPEIQTKA